MVQRERLKRWRRKNGLSQAEAAKKIGRAQATWAAWETGRKIPEGDNALRIERLTKGALKARGWYPGLRRASSSPTKDTDDAAPELAPTGTD